MCRCTTCQSVIACTTQVLADARHKDPTTTFVVIEEADTATWGMPAKPSPCATSGRAKRAAT